MTEFLDQIIELLKNSPESAIWVLVAYFIFTLSKMAGWVYLVKFLVALFINKFFADRELNNTNAKRVKELELKLAQAEKNNEVAKYFEDRSVNDVPSAKLIQLLDAVKGKRPYIHNSDLDTAIRLIQGEEERC